MGLKKMKILKDHNGYALVEAAIIFPLLILCLILVIRISLAFVNEVKSTSVLGQVLIAESIKEAKQGEIYTDIKGSSGFIVSERRRTFKEIEGRSSDESIYKKRYSINEANYIRWRDLIIEE